MRRVYSSFLLGVSGVLGVFLSLQGGADRYAMPRLLRSIIRRLGPVVAAPVRGIEGVHSQSRRRSDLAVIQDSILASIKHASEHDHRFIAVQ
jgi:hypothetical protein